MSDDEKQPPLTVIHVLRGSHGRPGGLPAPVVYRFEVMVNRAGGFAKAPAGWLACDGLVVTEIHDTPDGLMQNTLSVGGAGAGAEGPPSDLPPNLRFMSWVALANELADMTGLEPELRSLCIHTLRASAAVVQELRARAGGKGDA